ncbi:MAG TPA: acyl-CoA thioesterase [Holophaga sp.]|nr:acyl-CoA thioesterase [Holophaga sp.]
MLVESNLSKGYPACFDLRIDWSEIDALGHVNNLAIMRYVQSARVNVLEAMGMMEHHRTTGVGPILAKTSCQFLRQLHYPGGVRVCSETDHLKTTSVQMNHIVLNDQNEKIAEAHDVIVLFDFNRNIKHTLSADFRDQVMRFSSGRMA